MNKLECKKCCKNCLLYKQYYTIHNFVLVGEDRGICCKNLSITYVGHVCENYMPIDNSIDNNINPSVSINSSTNK